MASEAFYETTHDGKLFIGAAAYNVLKLRSVNISRLIPGPEEDIVGADTQRSREICQNGKAELCAAGFYVAHMCR